MLIAAAGGAFVIYGTREEAPSIACNGSQPPIVSALGLWLAPGWWGGDALGPSAAWCFVDTWRGWCCPSCSWPFPSCRGCTKARATSSTQLWRRIPVQAHLIHLGLLLLLIGHVFTTTLVDRGDPIHRITMLQDEAVVVDGLSYTFTDLTLVPEEDLRVGDGGIFATIDVRTSA